MDLPKKKLGNMTWGVFKVYTVSFIINQFFFKGSQGVVSNEKKSRFPVLPVEIKGKWMHIDKVESDKLAWLRDLPKPPEPGTKVSLRFICVGGGGGYADLGMVPKLGGRFRCTCAGYICHICWLVNSISLWELPF